LAALERPVGAEQPLDRHGAGEVGHGGQRGGVGHRQAGEREHPLGAVDQGEALLVGELQRLEAGAPQALRRRHALPVHLHLALADERQREVRELGQVAGGAHGAVLGDHRRHPGGQQREKCLHDDRAHARVALDQGAGAQQLHGPHDLRLQRVTTAGGVGQDDAALQLAQVGGGDRRIGQQAEPGRHPVHPPALGDRALHHVPGGGHALATLIAQLHRHPPARDGHHLIDPQRITREHQPLRLSAPAQPSHAGILPVAPPTSPPDGATSRSAASVSSCQGTSRECRHGELQWLHRRRPK
jgi:hypothetical protein